MHLHELWGALPATSVWDFASLEIQTYYMYVERESAVLRLTNSFHETFRLLQATVTIVEPESSLTLDFFSNKASIEA